MFWEYSVKESKLLLNATLLLFATGALFLVYAWQGITHNEMLVANSVGVYAGVEENEVNTLAMQLEAKEQELRNREQTLLLAENIERQKLTLFATMSMGVGLFGLILLNFYLDRKRRISFA
jgi:hypothetical protein